MNFTDFTTGNVTSWSWSFGDGGSSTSQSPSHIYVVAGTYTVSLTATGPGGSNTITKTNYINALHPAPIAEFSGTPLSGAAPLSVTFTNMTGGGMATGGTWYFGDLTSSTAQSPTHVYSSPGMYTVSLTATGPGGSDTETKVDYITVTDAAPTSNFTATPTSGTAPLAVNFTDLTSGMVTGWSWNFGDGGSSSSQNPMHTYASAGNYTVELTSSGPGGSDVETKIDFVVVNPPPPVANFTGSPTSGPAPLTVVFTNTTTGLATAGSWTFGDGATSSAPAPSHTYNSPGAYTVSLVATGPGGSDTETKFDYIVVLPTPPVASFSGTPLIGTAPLQVNFTNTSTGPITGVSWAFGDTTTSTTSNPSHIYSSPGLYTVSLSVTGPGGSDTETQVDYVTVIEPPPVTNFSASPRTGVEPVTVSFTDFSSGNVTSWSWSFGDGNTSNVQNPSHTYMTAGNFTVSLTATTSGGSNTETKTQYIRVFPQPPVADFSATPTTGLEPLSVGFSDLSTGDINTWSWDFGDLGSSSLQNPTHIYNDPGTYTVTLTIEGPGGSDSVTKIDHVTVNPLPPVADFSATPTTGSSPLAVGFTDMTTGDYSSWSWSFGDGGTSTAQNPAHTYVAAGSYTVSLTSTGAGGSHTETKSNYIVVSVPPPVADFSASPTTGLAPLSVTFAPMITGSATGGAWDFGDGGTSAQASPTHVYTSAGAYTVSLLATGPGGQDTETKFEYIVVTEPPPVAAFAGSPTTGVSPLTVSFSDQSTGAVTGWSWSFGDGMSSGLQSPNHTYEAPGVYTVSLLAVGPGGSNLHTKTGYVTVNEPPPVADFFAIPQVGVAPLTVNFSDFSEGAISTHSWAFGDGGNSTAANPSYTYVTPGLYTVSLTVTSAGGTDTETKVAYVQVTPPAPVADFSATPLAGPSPLMVAFSDASTGSITGRMWDFGDGSTSTSTNPMHTYSSPGLYTVTLTASGPGGVDSEIKTDYIDVGDPAPIANFSGAPLSGSVPLTVNFTDLTTGVVTGWSWSFGDGGMATGQNPSHTYTTAGVYTVSLTSTGPGGSTTETKNGYVTAIEPAPVADFSGTPLTGIKPLTVNFSDLTTGSVSSRSWDFGDLGTSSAVNPSHTYLNAGVYTVSLTATGPGGSDTETKVSYVTVDETAPVADFSGTPLSGIAPLTVGFTALTSGGPVSTYAWDFGDSGSSTAQNPSHVYLAAGTYTVSLTVTGAGGSDTATKAAYVTVGEPPPIAEFNGSPLSGATPLTVNFTDISGGAVNTWSWSFGDGGTSNLQHPSHTYLALGSYTVSLTVNGPGGVDTETKFDYVVAGNPPMLVDGSFEAQTAGMAPGAPWSITSGTAHVVNGTASDNGLPSQGTKWGEVGANGTNAATPPSNPGGVGSAPSGAAGISQSFSYPSNEPHLVFDAAFILSGPFASASFNDFMSIDVTDGSTTVNLFYKDTFSAFPNTSVKYSLPMTATEVVIADLSTLFPSSTPITPFTLTVQVGNGGDSSNPSKGYIDNVRLLTSALATPRNPTISGTTNPLCYLTNSPPALGGIWSVEVDHSSHVGATTTYVLGYSAPLSLNSPKFGNILVGGAKYFESIKAASGTSDTHTWNLPPASAALSLVGLPTATQAAILGGGVSLCNANDIVIGL